jgi:hypothetical protein
VLTCRSAIGDPNGFKASEAKKDVSNMEALFPDNPARRVTNKSAGEGGRKGVKKANESDVGLGFPSLWCHLASKRKELMI